MAWVAVHPDLTQEVQVPEEEGAPLFTVGFWPPREAERFKMTWADMQRTELDPVDQQDAYLKAVNINYEVARDMVRFGVRGWSGMRGADGKEMAPEFDAEGRLSEASLDLLYVNNLLAALSIKAFLFNVLSEDEKKKASLQSGSVTSSSDTDAESVITATKETEHREAS